jgi:hypothetical protein
MTLRRYLDAAVRRQPFASRASLEATAADLRSELLALRAQHAETLEALRRVYSELEGIRSDVIRQLERADEETVRAWNELADRTQAWGARLLDVEARLGERSAENAT